MYIDTRIIYVFFVHFAMQISMFYDRVDCDSQVRGRSLWRAHRGFTIIQYSRKKNHQVPTVQHDPDIEPIVIASLIGE